ncbi:MAG: hypothetical protein HUU46_23145 [Candidatus Hydrogenedentes bacterium]|nr:hypothetical protein [Candidatus Hydrogenedentota bacterium]
MCRKNKPAEFDVRGWRATDIGQHYQSSILSGQNANLIRASIPLMTIQARQHSELLLRGRGRRVASATRHRAGFARVFENSLFLASEFLTSRFFL